jgi:APA family basic amino acid/polyamine antiporter
MVTAVKLAGKRRRAVHVIAIVTVPNHLPLDAPLGRQEEEAQSKIEQAKLIGGLRVSGHVHRARTGQAGHSIAEEARELKASALVMGLRYRNGTPLYGKTLQTVLAERPTRVIVVALPERGRSAASPAGPPVSPGIGAPA